MCNKKEREGQNDDMKNFFVQQSPVYKGLNLHFFKQNCGYKTMLVFCQKTKTPGVPYVLINNHNPKALLMASSMSWQYYANQEGLAII